VQDVPDLPLQLDGSPEREDGSQVDLLGRPLADLRGLVRCGRGQDVVELQEIDAEPHALQCPYGRLHALDVPCREIAGAVEDVGNGPGLIVVDILFRMLQPHELSRAHSFGDDYIFAGPREEKVKQIGNSVPRNLAKALETMSLCIELRKSQESSLTEFLLND